MEVKLYQGLLEINWNLLFSAITVLVLYLILKHFFFEKVHNFMEARKAAVQASLDQAEAANERHRHCLLTTGPRSPMQRQKSVRSSKQRRQRLTSAQT